MLKFSNIHLISTLCLIKTNLFNTYFVLSIDITNQLASFLNILFIYREGKGRRKREREKHQCVVASHVPPTGDLAHNPGMCPDWESNSKLLVCNPAPRPLSHTSQDSISFFIKERLGQK